MTNTNTHQKAPGATNSNGLHTETSVPDFLKVGLIQRDPYGDTFLILMSVAYSHLKEAVSGIYIQRGVRIDAIGATKLRAVFGSMRVFQ